MKRPTINDYPQTDSRTYYNLDGTVNWKKYAEALEEYAESLSPAAEPTHGINIEALKKHLEETPFELLQDEWAKVMAIFPQPAAVKESLTVEPITAEEFVIQKYGENWLNIMWSPEDVLDALEEYASLKRTVAEREVGDE